MRRISANYYIKDNEKILEKVVKEQLEAYIEKHKILTRYQSGFRKNFSCQTTVNFEINKWKKLTNQKTYGNIFRQTHTH